jgi:hypothetical protein
LEDDELGLDGGEPVFEGDEVTHVLGHGVLEVLDLLGQHVHLEGSGLVRVVLEILATTFLVVVVAVAITAFLGLAVNQTGWRAAESLSARLWLLVGVGVASGHGRLRVDHRTSADGRRRRRVGGVGRRLGGVFGRRLDAARQALALALALVVARIATHGAVWRCLMNDSSRGEVF